MPQNTLQTRKKFHSSKKNNHKYTMKGGADALQKANDEAKEELQEEIELLTFINEGTALDVSITAIRDVKGQVNPISTAPGDNTSKLASIKKLMNSFQLTGETGIYNAATITGFIIAIIQAKVPGKPVAVPSTISLEEVGDRYIPKVVNNVNEYHKLLTEIRKLKKRQFTLDAYGEGDAAAVSGLQTDIDTQKKNLREELASLKIQRVNNADKDISLLNDLYLHKNLNLTQQAQ